MFSMTTYLTEKPLGDILRAWAGDDNVTAQPMVAGTRMRHDYEVKKDGVTYVVEFNGDSHYRDPNVIFRDQTKEFISSRLGKKVVQIPYFIQLTTETFKVLFDADFEIETTFPHGFVATKMLPSSFCPIGYARAKGDLAAMPESVQRAVMESLARKAEKLDDVLVYFTNSVNISPEEVINWHEFVRRANEVHGGKYSYPHPL